jgi:hypothetical protein
MRRPVHGCHGYRSSPNSVPWAFSSFVIQSLATTPLAGPSSSLRRGDASPAARMSKDRRGTCARWVAPYLSRCCMTYFCALQLRARSYHPWHWTGGRHFTMRRNRKGEISLPNPNKYMRARQNGQRACTVPQYYSIHATTIQSYRHCSISSRFQKEAGVNGLNCRTFVARTGDTYRPNRVGFGWSLVICLSI